MDIEKVEAIAEETCGERGWGIPKFIDAGASGAVFEVEHPKFGLTALKVYDPKYFQGENALIEENRVRLQTSLTHLDHKNLIRTFEAEPLPAHGTWFILMEFCPWPSLQKKIADIPDEHVPALIRQLAEVVIYLTANDIVHRDIKPANIAISDQLDQIKLLDLGVLRQISFAEGNGTDQDEKKRFVATAQYSPPEYLTRSESSGIDGFIALNVYQVGAVLHDLIMKRSIFSDEAESLNRYRLYNAITGRVPTVFNANVPVRLVSICRASLLKQPEKRMSAVKLEDFTQEFGDPDEARRRLQSLRRDRSDAPTISALPWQRKARNWIADAAIAEKSILGPYKLQAKSQDGCHSWLLHFDDLALDVCFALRTDVSTGALEFVLLGLDASSSTTILNVGPDGPDIPQDQIVPQIREQMLYLLDSLPTTGAHGADQ